MNKRFTCLVETLFHLVTLYKHLPSPKNNSYVLNNKIERISYDILLQMFDFLFLQVQKHMNLQDFGPVSVWIITTERICLGIVHYVRRMED